VIPSLVSQRSVAIRLNLISNALTDIESLPLFNQEAYFADHRNIWTCESCLRRSLEALLDIGRHILAKAFGEAVTEYRKIPASLQKYKVLTQQEAEVLTNMAGYRNRMVHFYHEVTQEELYNICANRLDEIRMIQNAYRRWMREHPDQVDTTL
jgi:uncharacterized protein YutE (UPF0331/DUF86 family)